MNQGHHQRRECSRAAFTGDITTWTPQQQHRQLPGREQDGLAAGLDVIGGMGMDDQDAGFSPPGGRTLLMRVDLRGWHVGAALRTGVQALSKYRTACAGRPAWIGGRSVADVSLARADLDGKATLFKCGRRRRLVGR